jgi:hypothetical protein
MIPFGYSPAQVELISDLSKPATLVGSTLQFLLLLGLFLTGWTTSSNAFSRICQHVVRSMARRALRCIVIWDWLRLN